MVEFDVEFLITLVQERPVLWDKGLELYKDRIATKNAWREVLVELNPEFDALDDKEKNLFGQGVIKRWTNLRDSFSKYFKKYKECKRSGSGVKKMKKYVYSDQLQFLRKIYVERPTSNSLEPEPRNDPENEEDDIEPQLQASGNVSDISREKTSNPKKGRKDKSQDDIDLKIIKLLEEKEQPCNKMAFLQSLLPHLQQFDNQDYLRFQMGVLKVIENINESKKEKHFATSSNFAPYQQLYVNASNPTQYHPRQLFNTPNHPNVFLSRPYSTKNQQIPSCSKQLTPVTTNQEVSYTELEQISPSGNSVASSITESIDFCKF